jgi:hypothetical protein
MESMVLKSILKCELCKLWTLQVVDFASCGLCKLWTLLVVDYAKFRSLQVQNFASCEQVMQVENFASCEQVMQVENSARCEQVMKVLNLQFTYKVNPVKFRNLQVVNIHLLKTTPSNCNQGGRMSEQASRLRFTRFDVNLLSKQNVSG